jgi:hypothetical protein
MLMFCHHLYQRMVMICKQCSYPIDGLSTVHVNYLSTVHVAGLPDGLSCRWSVTRVCGMVYICKLANAQLLLSRKLIALALVVCVHVHRSADLAMFTQLLNVY